MPELPEVETIKRQLENTVIGRKITKIDVLNSKTFIGNPSLVLNKPIIKISRCAKILEIIFCDNSALCIHFKMTGRLLHQPQGEFLPERFTRIIFYLDDGSRLLFDDPRKFGWVKALKDILAEPQCKAIEPLSSDFTLANFSKIIQHSKKPIKLLLMDQNKIGGIGNIYANEILFAARINPFRIANSLGDCEIKKLYQSTLKILAKAIRCKGSSGKDEWYRQLNGEAGGYQKHFTVYQREGKKCLICANKIQRKNLGGRGTFYCPNCQK